METAFILSSTSDRVILIKIWQENRAPPQHKSDLTSILADLDGHSWTPKITVFVQLFGLSLQNKRFFKNVTKAKPLDKILNYSQIQTVFIKMESCKVSQFSSKTLKTHIFLHVFWNFHDFSWSRGSSTSWLYFFIFEKHSKCHYNVNWERF